MSTQKRATPSRRRRRRRARPDEAEAAAPERAVPPAPAPEPPAAGDVIVTTNPEPRFAARMPPPEPPRPLPTAHRVIFFDVENTSRPEHVVRVLDHLSPDWTRLATELVAVGNWRVIGHETARVLAQRGAQCVHSAPANGVRDWSDLRIAIAAGAWLAAARPGDAIEIISDDHAFDAVGDVAASLGVSFRRLSYRGLAGLAPEMPADEMRRDSGPRRRRRGGRRAGRDEAPVRHVAPARAADAAEPHGAPEDVIIAIVRELLAASPAGVTLDALSNTLKARGFGRPPGSLRLITRLRRMKPLEVSRDNILRLAEPESGEPPPAASPETVASDTSATEMPASEAAVGEGGMSEQPAATNEGGRRRRRRRGGRRRRGRGRGGPVVAAAP